MDVLGGKERWKGLAYRLTIRSMPPDEAERIHLKVGQPGVLRWMKARLCAMAWTLQAQWSVLTRGPRTGSFVFLVGLRVGQD